MRISDWSSDVCSSDLLAQLQQTLEAVDVGQLEVQQHQVEVFELPHGLQRPGRRGRLQQLAGPEAAFQQASKAKDYRGGVVDDQRTGRGSGGEQGGSSC